MNKENNIEELFRSTFETFEAPVDPSVWTAIQSGIAAKTAGAAVVAKTGAGIVKTLIISGSTLMAGLGLGYVFFGDTTNTSQKISGQQVSARVDQPTAEETSDHTNSASNENVKENTKVDVVIPVENQSTGNKQKITITVNREESGNQSIVNGWLSNTPNDWNRYYQERERDIANSKNENTSTDKSVTNEKVPVEVENLTENMPLASIEASVYAGPAPLVVKFSNATKENDYTWDFGDGSTASENVSPEHIYREAGTYTVKLVVRNKAGKTDVQTATIEVTEGSSIELITPNVFSPNNDGENDVFAFKGRNIKEFQLEIYSRTGKVVFRTNILEEGWNGEDMSGKQAPAGLYLYVYTARGFDNRQISDKGTVTLFR